MFFDRKGSIPKELGEFLSKIHTEITVRNI